MSNKIAIINQQLVNEALTFERIIAEHNLRPGKLFYIHSTSSNTNTATGIETTYNQLCARFSDGKFYSLKKVSFNNQLCSSNAKPGWTEPNKPIKNCIIRFRLFKREEIESGDYVMPNTASLSPEQIAEIKQRYTLTIDNFVRENEMLINFHKVLEYEWQELNKRMKTGENDDSGNILMPKLLTENTVVGTTVLDKIEKKEQGKPVVIPINPPRYTWKIPVFHPHKKSSYRSQAYNNRLGQVFMNDDRFEPVVCDMEASLLASKDGKKNLIEASLKGLKDGKPHEEPITCFNVGKFITRKSKIGGYLDISQSSVSGKGHCLKILAGHLLVKKHKTNEKEDETQDGRFEAMIATNGGCAEVEDTLYDFSADNNTDFKSTPAMSSQSNSDTSELNNLAMQYNGMNVTKPVNQMMSQPQMMPQMMNQMMPQMMPQSQQMMPQQMSQQMTPAMYQQQMMQYQQMMQAQAQMQPQMQMPSAQNPQN